MIYSELYGGFMVSKNIFRKIPVRYSFREESSAPQLNGWILLSGRDDADFVGNPDNFEIVDIEVLLKIAPRLLEIIDAPYGTDLLWLYDKGVHTGFYDLKAGKEVTVEEILKQEKLNS